MSEITLALIGGGAGIGGAIIGWYLGARSERQNRQLEMIMDIYRPLIEDLRTSIRQCSYNFKTAWGSIDGRFTILTKYFTDGTMKAVEGYDAELYTKLVDVRDEVLDSLVKIERSKMESLKIIKRGWIKILEATDTDIHKGNFANTLASSIIWEIWRGNIELVKTEYDEKLANLRQQVASITPPPESTFQELIDLANKEFDKVRSTFPAVEERFKQIEDEIISKMEITIKDQF